MDKSSKKILHHLKTCTDFTTDIYGELFTKLEMSESEFYNTISYLEKKELVHVIRDQFNHPVFIKLSHESVHETRFRFEAFMHWFFHSFLGGYIAGIISGVLITVISALLIA